MPPELVHLCIEAVNQYVASDICGVIVMVCTLTLYGQK